MEQEQSVEVSESLGAVVVSTDDRPIYEAWRKGNASESLAYTATQKVRELAGINGITVLGTKVEALDAKVEAQGSELRSKVEALDAKVEAQGSELRSKVEALDAKVEAQIASLRWMLGILIALCVSILGLLVQLQLRSPGQAVGVPAARPALVAPPAVEGSPEEVGASVAEEVPPAAP